MGQELTHWPHEPQVLAPISMVAPCSSLSRASTCPPPRSHASTAGRPPRAAATYASRGSTIAAEEARRLLDELPASVCDAAGHRDGFDDDNPLGGMHWLNDLDRTLADDARIQILAALTKLAQR